ncbi:predicted protein [Uncinocarpus reesii 1704]|uniref:Ubiquitin-like protein ATG12 n=1 Tax=Uncinocarpus reesii (strain UAMH 1704) TaxID=336963 RepID=C4JGE1_UNCRE|nr:uncharacterized protein UREG_01132 [Uncinocarpus reesii 1704]EEP76283.1 predicted protein [Uncinocarpus reesii 1704]
MPSAPPTPSPDSSKPSSPRSSSRGLGLLSRQASHTQFGASRNINNAPESPVATAPIPDEDHGAELPLTMTASVILTGLPKDAHRALTDVEAIDAGKVVRFLRKKLDCRESDSVFCYVNSVFAPGLDESVGGLWRCFKTDDQLIVSYSMTPAFG